MRSTLMLAVASALVAGAAAAEAPKVTGNPDVTYKAEIADSNENGVGGFVEITAGPDANGADVQFEFNLPEEGGPFTFHIHVSPINSTGSCASTGGHLDPYGATDTHVCDPTEPELCEVGDISGKLGRKFPAGEIAGNISDDFISLVEGTPAFIGNRSIVVHASDKSRIACANFELVKNDDNGGGSAGPTGGNGGGSASPTGGAGGGGSATNGTTGVTRPTVTPTATPTGGAALVSGSVMGLLGVLAVGAALL
ncbi:Cell surface superoxide dismutase [Cu-Zn] 4 [Pseudogymnoascus australis]